MNFFNKNNRWKSKRAETILEVIAAIFVIAVGSASATSLVVSSLRSNGLSRDNLIAMNLAVEGVEAMRNIRDSNWLRFAYDKDNCWNMKADKTVCQDSDLIPQSNFSPVLDTTTMKWSLGIVGGAGFELNLASGASYNEMYRLAYKDLNLSFNSDGMGGTADDMDLYVPKGTANSFGLSKFYRMVSVSYPSGDPTTDSQMFVTSLVQWKDAAVHQVKLVTELSNYQKVKVK